VWSFPRSPTNANRKTGYWNIDARLIVKQEPGPTVTMFWAATFGIEGGGGYIGIQDGAARGRLRDALLSNRTFVAKTGRS